MAQFLQHARDRPDHHPIIGSILYVQEQGRYQPPGKIPPRLFWHDGVIRRFDRDMLQLRYAVTDGANGGAVFLDDRTQMEASSMAAIRKVARMLSLTAGANLFG